MKILLLSSIFFIHFNNFAINKTEGTWIFQEITEISNKEAGLQPFPQNITIESINEDEGKIMILLPTQSKPKIYSFSQNLVKNSTTFQTYHSDTENEYILKEEVTTSYSDNILSIQLTWSQPTCEERLEFLPDTSVCLEIKSGTEDTEQSNVIATGSYIITLDGEILHFTRNHKNQYAEDVFKARYFLQE